MKINIRGNKIVITDSIKNYIEGKIGKLDKYFDSPDDITASVVVQGNGIYHKIEVTIPIKRDILRGEESDKDLYAAIDFVSEKLERQIRKNKTKMKHKNNRENYDLFIDFEVSEEEQETTQIVKRKEIDTKPMNEEEAILQMNLLGHDFFVFKNIDTDNISVVYKRKDSNYGIINTKIKLRLYFLL